MHVGRWRDHQRAVPATKPCMVIAGNLLTACSVSLISARALWLAPPCHAFLATETIAPPDRGQLLIRSCYSAVSRGTETLVYAGQVPPSEYQRMQAPFQAGELPDAVKHGYANVGVVEDGPASWIGQRVFCLYPHQTRYVVPAEAVIPVPATVPGERAVLAANMETALNACWDSAPSIGDRVTVVGAGVIGGLIAGLCASLAGADVELVDINADRQTLAHALGARFALPGDAADGRDLVIHASGQAEGLATALGLAGFEATVLEMSWYGERPTQVPLGGAFHSQRLNLRASQVGSVAPSHRPRWTHARRLALAVSLLADPCFDALLAPRDACFVELPDVMARLADPADRTLCQRIVYDSP